jgi:hypothetical protein
MSDQAMGREDKACQAIPSGDLEHQIMSSCVPKNEREWWAQRTIAALREELAKYKAESEAWEKTSLVAIVAERDRLRKELAQAKQERDQVIAEAVGLAENLQYIKAWRKRDYGRAKLFLSSPPVSQWRKAKALTALEDGLQ